MAQGAILGLTLWNILYNNILEITLQRRAKSIAFPNNLTLIVTAGRKANDVKFAPKKAETLIITKKTNCGLMFIVDNGNILPRRSHNLYERQLQRTVYKDH